jgi:hypothetical protein
MSQNQSPSRESNTVPPPVVRKFIPQLSFDTGALQKYESGTISNTVELRWAVCTACMCPSRWRRGENIFFVLSYSSLRIFALL